MLKYRLNVFYWIMISITIRWLLTPWGTMGVIFMQCLIEAKNAYFVTVGLYHTSKKKHGNW
jgi:hypothetical protein